jgi:hypothetical protein
MGYNRRAGCEKRAILHHHLQRAPITHANSMAKITPNRATSLEYTRPAPGFEPRGMSQPHLIALTAERPDGGGMFGYFHHQGS